MTTFFEEETAKIQKSLGNQYNTRKFTAAIKTFKE
jgi:hypothetical protein